MRRDVYLGDGVRAHLDAEMNLTLSAQDVNIVLGPEALKTLADYLSECLGFERSQ